MNTSSNAFEVIMAPVTEEVFFGDYWEQQSLHLSRNDESRFSGLIDTTSIEQVLASGNLEFPRVQMTHNNRDTDEPLPVYYDTENKILANRVAENYKNGATLILTEAHKHFKELSALSQRLSAQLSLNCRANAYLTPPGQQGFAAHYDTHDVVVLKVSGTKRFDFYKGGTVLPFNNSIFDPETSEVGEQYDSITLEPGDSLYIPRGIVHNAVADESESSLHITLGIYATTVADLLIESIMAAAEQQPELRNSVPYDNFKNGMITDQDRTQFASLITAATTTENIQSALSTILDTKTLELPSARTGLLSGQNSTQLTAASKISLQSDTVCSWELNTKLLKLRIPGQVIELDEHYRDALELLLGGKPAQVDELPGLAGNEAIALAQQLADLEIVVVL